MRVGLVGFPFSGKTTFLKALAEYCGSSHISSRVVVKVPDERLDELARIFSPKKITHLEMEFSELGGLDPHDPKRNAEVLMKIQEVDAVLIVVKAFKSDLVPEVEGFEDPSKQIEYILDRLLSRDLDILAGRIDRLENSKRKLTNVEEMELKFLKSIHSRISSEGAFPRDLSESDLKTLSGYSLVSTKGRVVLMNVGEDGKQELRENVLKRLEREGVGYHEMPVKLIKDLFDLDEEERQVFMEEFGIEDPGFGRLIREIMRSSGLGVFYTVKGGELRAWEMKLGSTAIEVAGRIHSDMARGFIRAEVMAFEDLVREGSEKALREKGLIKVVGKEHVIDDGDVVFIKFNV